MGLLDLVERFEVFLSNGGQRYVPQTTDCADFLAATFLAATGWTTARLRLADVAEAV
jgi:hypothetical protein